MARIELSNIGGGGTTLSLTTTGTSGASTLAGSVLNIPIYQGQLTLTTTGTSGAATLVGDTLNIPNYATGGNPAGSAGQVQFNSTPAGSFAASANLAWDDTAVQLNVNAPISPTGKLNVKGGGTTSATVNTRLTDSGNAELLKVLDNGSTNIGANFNWDNVNGRLGLGTSTPNQTLEVSGAMRLTGTAGTASFMLGRNSAGDVSTVTLGTTGTSGAATLSANVLNIPQYQGALTLTTTGTSGAATLVGNTLNIPQYSGGGGTPAGSTGQIQYNNAGAFGASANLAWVNSPNPQLNLNAPISPTGVLNVRGTGTTTTVNTRLTNSGNTELFSVLDNGDINLQNASYANYGFLNISCITPDITTGYPAIRVTSPGSTRIRINSSAAAASDFNAGFSLLHNNSSKWSIAAFQSGYNFVFYNDGLSAAALYIDGSNNNMSIGGTFTPSARFHVRGSNTSSGTNALLIQNNRSPTPDNIYRIENDGKISYLATNTAAGTTGAQTINRPSGTVNFAAGATSLVVTNSLCTTASIVLPVIRTNDATAQIKNVVPGAGSFTINLSAAATAETSVGFFIIN